jgi:hypothetical protein
MYSVYQHWDPLRVCAVGRSYPPEFYSWITVPHVRELFERIALETEEDYQNIIKKLLEFGVEIVRPNVDYTDNEFLLPPMNPRDSMIMIGEKFYTVLKDWKTFYRQIKNSSWPEVDSIDDLNLWQQQECLDHGWNTLGKFTHQWKPIYDKVLENNGDINSVWQHQTINGAGVSRIGRDLYFSIYDEQVDQQFLNFEFSNYRTHLLTTQGHGDGTYCPVCPGLIISLMDIPTYEKTFPGWEVVYLPDQSWSKVQPFLDLKQKNKGRWWIPGFEYDQDVVDVVESWLGHWTGYVEETVFDVNMLIIDPKNVMVFNYNKQVFDALERYGITAHIVPFRHRYFWDGGIHCVTLDLHREGVMQDFFNDR